MEHPVDAELIESVRRYRLRFACGDCAHFDEEGGTCSLGLRTSPHREPVFDGRSTMSFCKVFELR